MCNTTGSSNLCATFRQEKTHYLVDSVGITNAKKALEWQHRLRLRLTLFVACGGCSDCCCTDRKKQVVPHKSRSHKVHSLTESLCHWWRKGDMGPAGITGESLRSGGGGGHRYARCTKRPNLYSLVWTESKPNACRLCLNSRLYTQKWDVFYSFKWLCVPAVSVVQQLRAGAEFARRLHSTSYVLTEALMQCNRHLKELKEIKSCALQDLLNKLPSL